MSILFKIQIDKYDDKPLYLQLYECIKKLIVENKLLAHTKLPSIRNLSNNLSVNNITVINAYKLLEQNNFVYKKIGSGTYVKELLVLNDNEKSNNKYAGQVSDVS